MTHDELLAKVTWIENTATPTEFCEVEMCERNLRQLVDALRAVVELHKPQEITLPDGEWGANCIECDGYDYPCPTIQAIEKELG